MNMPVTTDSRHAFACDVLAVGKFGRTVRARRRRCIDIGDVEASAS